MQNNVVKAVSVSADQDVFITCGLSGLMQFLCILVGFLNFDIDILRQSPQYLGRCMLAHL